MVIFPLKMLDLSMKNGDLPIQNGDFPTKNAGSFHSYVDVYQRLVTQLQ